MHTTTNPALIDSLFKLLFITLACSLLLACEEVSIPEDNWDKNIALNKAVDINNNASVVEINLEAVEKNIELRPGVFTKMWTYNGTFPGPTIEANVGDTLIVNFTNNLNTSTTIHWHGLELPANMDGSMLAQTAIPANGGTFRYEFKLLNAATYWYHPHIESNVQVEKGLYGALIVREPDIDKQLNFPSKETTIILDDILLDDLGQIEPPSYQEPIADPIANATTQLNGREGDVFLINGKALEPLISRGDDIQVIQVHSGTPVRLRLINAANARFFRLSIPDHTIYQIGGDGGLLPSPIAKESIPLLINNAQAKPNARNISARDGEPLVFTSDPDLNKGVMLVPGERSDIIFTPNGEAGDIAYLEWHFFPRGFHGVEDDGTGNLIINHNHQSALTAPFRILKFEFDETSKLNQQTYIPPSTLRTIPLIQQSISTPILPITFGHGLPDPTTGNIDFFAAMKTSNTGIPTGVPFSMQNNEIDAVSLYATVNQTYIWEVSNLTQGDHPFHPHGFTFQHISTEYFDSINVENNRIEFPVHPNELKDTIRIPGRLGARGSSKTVVKLAVQFTDIGREGTVQATGKFPSAGLSGGWFVHCHILEHSNRGMGTYLNLLY